MSQRGQIYHNPKFRFHDGKIGNKLLILLNTPHKNEEYIFVKTTSNDKNRLNKPGCHKHPIFEQGEYYLHKGSTFLDQSTWVIVSDIYPIVRKSIDNNANWIKLKGMILPTNIVDKIIDCLFRFIGDDIPEIYEQSLRPSINESILKLQEKFRS
ncbi:MAG: hypothetical protein OMM_10814 [Candidatus Magnetoglobus multicellularis str. Araruama]|uniref:Uncharacterized protein n=1 Tax=Candidatus Magnetoglobus multicellularis str. Araruama TaxID=890399 RepID=A0A1V1P034_9BACT|nr:MAG: hypothetical protein OMM_10814 [Candidatus Magnetoglobus multicellularis str. Araruama]